MPVFIGTSGWQYAHWRNRFYPRAPRVKDELAYFSERFQTVEINASFYRLPGPETFEDWSARVPEDFRFAVKASRYLTHIRRLTQPADPVRRLLEHASKLGEKLGPILLQLPPTLRIDAGLLHSALTYFPHNVRVAVEFRHDSWFTESIRQILTDRNDALSLVDRGSQLLTPAWRTADWSYIRFHWGTSTPESCYEEATLNARAQLLRRLWGPDADVYVYLNNDAHACALRDACRFAAAARAVGLQPTRVAALPEIMVN